MSEQPVQEPVEDETSEDMTRRLVEDVRRLEESN
jgi:hypothetical protein